MSTLFRRHSRAAFLTRFAALSILGFSVILSGCGSGSGSSPTTSPTPLPSGTRTQQPGWTLDNNNNGDTTTQPAKKWTILVYLNGANDLEEFGPLNVNQMEQYGSNDTDRNIVVQFKRIKGRYSTADGDWGGTRRYYVTKDNNTSSTSSLQLSHRDNVNMGDDDTLKEFVKWGLQTYPAEHYCLVVWNHGAGWRAQKLPGATRAASSAHGVMNGRGVSYDEEFEDGTGNTSHIDTIQLPAAIDMSSVLPGRKWDLLAFDSSLMQMAEVAYEIRDKVQYIVGSEESPPGEGFPYDLVLRDMTANPSMDGRTLGISFARNMLSAYGNNSDVTESVLDASKLGALAPAIESLGRALSAAGGNTATNIVNARLDAENYAYEENRDLLHFTQTLEANGVTANSGVAAAVAQVRSALASVIIFNNNGRQHPNSNGLSIFLPSVSDYKNIDLDQEDGFGQRYPALALSKDAPGWQNFINGGR